MEPKEYTQVVQRILAAGKTLLDCEKDLYEALQRATDQGDADQAYVLARTHTYVAVCTSVIVRIAEPMDKAAKKLLGGSN